MLRSKKARSASVSPAFSSANSFKLPRESLDSLGVGAIEIGCPIAPERRQCRQRAPVGNAEALVALMRRRGWRPTGVLASCWRAVAVATWVVVHMRRCSVMRLCTTLGHWPWLAMRWGAQRAPLLVVVAIARHCCVMVAKHCVGHVSIQHCTLTHVIGLLLSKNRGRGCS